MLKQHHWFECFVFLAKRYCSFLIPEKEKTKNRMLSFWDEEYEDAVRFTGLKISKEGVLALAYSMFLFVFLFLCTIDIIIIFVYSYSGVSFDLFTTIIMLIATSIIPFVLMQFIVNYPKTLVTYTKIQSIGDIPEVLSYIVMSLKLSPNLEHALSYTAKESSNTLVRDLRKILWDIQIRVFYNVSDAITVFATKWGRYNEAFKRSLHLIRSSIDEPDEAQRILTLNKALDVGLEGTRDMMRSFADSLHQPIMITYSIGIMIPLSIIAMLPAAGLIGLHITIFQVFFIYDVFLPLILLFYMRNVLLHRPAAFTPPHISKHHPAIQKINVKKTILLSLLIAVSISSPALVYISSLLYPQLNHFSFVSYMWWLNEFIPVSLFLLWGVVLGFSFYTHHVYTPFQKIRNKIKNMEREFSDALYIIGKRLHEGKSPEESISYTAEMMKGSVISSLFSDTVFMLSARHATIHSALFHPEYGSLKEVYSPRIHAIMKLFVKGIKKSQQTASLSIVRLADHLKALQEVEKHIRESLATLTATLRSTANLFAPLIAGVTLAITQLISSIVEKMLLTTSTDPLFSNQQTVLPGIATTFALENIQPIWFILVIGIYVIELVILLTRFTNGIEDGDDPVAFMYDLGHHLPIALFVLTISIFASSLFLDTLAINV